MFQTTLVLISGKQGSGKTSTANELGRILKGKPGFVVHQSTFAKVIYEMHDAIREIGDKYGIPRREPKDGPLLQLLGTEWGRSIDPDIWIKALRKDIERNQVEGQHLVVIVSDCRFQNEFDAFPEALRVRLNCPVVARHRRCSMWRENSNHLSEIDLDQRAEAGQFDLTLDTEITPTAGVATLIAAQIQKQTWLEKRK